MTLLNKLVKRVSNTKLSHAHGSDRHRRIVVALLPGNGLDIPDMIELRPERTQRPRRVALEDLYSYLIRCEINQKLMAKLRERKAKRHTMLERRRSLRIIKGT